MSFFKTEAPQVSAQQVVMATQSPLKAISNAMGDLNSILDNRAKEQYTKSVLESLRGVKDTEGLIQASSQLDFTKMSEQGLSALDRMSKNIQLGEQAKQREFTMGMQEQQFELQEDKFEFEKEQKGLDRIRQEKIDKLNETKIRAEIAKANRVDSPTTIKEMTALGYPITQEGYTEYINAKARSTTRKPTSFEEKDRYFNEAQKLKQIKNRTPQQEERLGFLENQLLASTAGKSEVKEKLDEKQLEVGFKTTQDLSKFLDIPTDAKNTDLGKMKRLENSYFKNTEKQQSKSTQDNIDTLKANQIVVDSIGKVFDDYSKNPKKYDMVKKGIVDDFIQGTRKIFGESITSNQLESMQQNIDFNTRAGRILTSFIKATSGLTVSDKERAFLQDILLGGNLSDESAVLTAMDSFRKSIKNESDLLAGQIYTDAPYSATKFRQYVYSDPNFKTSKGVTQKDMVTIGGKEFKVGAILKQDGKRYQVQANGTTKEL